MKSCRTDVQCALKGPEMSSELLSFPMRKMKRVKLRRSPGERSREICENIRVSQPLIGRNYGRSQCVSPKIAWRKNESVSRRVASTNLKVVEMCWDYIVKGIQGILSVGNNTDEAGIITIMMQQLQSGYFRRKTHRLTERKAEDSQVKSATNYFRV